MTCAEFRDDVAGYALGALDPAEQAACAAHLAEPIAHEGCHEALAEAYETAALLGAALPQEAPRAQVWQAIERAIGAAPDAATGPATRRRAAAGRPAGRPRTREIVAWACAAAAVVAAVGLGLAYRTSERTLAGREHALTVASSAEHDAQVCLRELASARFSLREKEAALTLIGSPGTQLVQLAAQGGEEKYHASAILNPAERRAMILTTALKPLAGKDYQLWLIRGDQKISGGILRTDQAGATLERISADALAGGRPDAFAVTIEPRGGVPQPTGPIILLGKVHA